MSKKTKKLTTRKEIAEEFIKCSSDYAYYAENYAVTYDETKGKKVPFVLFPQQKEFIQNLMDYHFNIVPKSRQSGISTSTALYCALHLLFTKDAKICIVAHKRDGAENFMKKISEFLHDRPTWIGDDGKQIGIYITNESKSRITLNNGSEAQAFASSSNSLRSFTPTLLILDETAFIPNAKELWTAASPTLSTGGRAIFISTPNGMDSLFYRTYEQSLSGRNNFHITYIRWWRDSRYNKGLVWRKEGEEVYEESDEARMFELYKEGYTPWSPWFETACSLLNHDERRIAQEYQIEFLGSSQTVIPTKYLKDADNTVREPLAKNKKYPEIHYYSEPREGATYICGADVASGTSADSSSAVVLDAQTMDVMAEYHGKCSPNDFAYILEELCVPYNNATIAVDTTGGLGSSTLIVLMEIINYPNIYHSYTRKRTLKDRLDPFSSRKDDKVPGFYITTGNRNDMVESFANAIRQGELEIVSNRLLSELKTFIYKESGKAEHMPGCNDDMIFAYMICTFIISYDMKNVAKGNQTAKTMLNAFISATGGLNKTDDGWVLKNLGSRATEHKTKDGDKARLPKYGFRF